MRHDLRRDIPARMRLGAAAGTIAWMQGRTAVDDTADPARLGGYRKNRLSIPSPWAGPSTHINTIAYADIFGSSAQLITRSQAMSIPGVARARGIILSLIADKPLVAYRAGDRLEPQPTWLYRTPGWAGPWRRMAATLDDHFFYGVSLWATTRGATSSGLAPILTAQHVPFDEWEIDEAGRICLLDQDGHYVPADESDVILIPGASEGLLEYASRTLRGAVELEKAWVSRAKNPIPAIDLHETIQSGLDPDEAQAVVDQWAQSRESENGSIAFTPYAIEARALGQYSPDLFTSGRNSSRLDIAAFAQIPGSLLDASTASASLTYVTQEGQASSLDTLTVPYWARPIEDRLGQDDVVPIGQSVRFAWAQAYTEPQGPIITSSSGHPAIQDAAQIVGDEIGAATADAVQPIARPEGAPSA